MENTAEDYSDKLNKARLASPGDFHVPQKGRSDNYLQNAQADNYAEEKDDEGDHAKRLENARAANIKGNNDLRDKAKAVAEMATPMGAVSLLGQINFIGDMPFVATAGAAMLKDLLDFATAETIILSAVFSMLCSIFIFMMLLLEGANGEKKVVNGLLKKMGFLVGGGMLDSIPVLNFFPIETATVALIYFLTLIERKNASKE